MINIRLCHVLHRKNIFSTGVFVDKQIRMVNRKPRTWCPEQKSDRHHDPFHNLFLLTFLKESQWNLFNSTRVGFSVDGKCNVYIVWQKSTNLFRTTGWCTQGENTDICCKLTGFHQNLSLFDVTVSLYRMNNESPNSLNRLTEK